MVKQVMKTVEHTIRDIITPSLEAKDLEVVQVKMIDGSKRKTLQILVENMKTGRVTLDECSDASRTISALLDVEDVIASAYQLEVSSPGIDRPLVKPADFERYLGFEAKIETQLPVQGRRRFKGQLITLEDQQLSIRVDATEYSIPLSNIMSAKLVLNDALMKAHKQGLFGQHIETEKA